MELPSPLRDAIDRALIGVALSELARAAGRLSRRYRAEPRDGRYHLSDDLMARAYLATRLPATYAAIRAAMGEIAAARSDFAPATALDVGAGPGTALWAAADCWPMLADALLIEVSPAIRAWGERLSAQAAPARIVWRSGDIAADLRDLAPRDLVTAAYVLGELAPEARASVVEKLWSLTADTLLVVEPGTPAGWARILAARDRLIAAGAHLLAPCPHAAHCPLAAPDWCHFSRRVARSRSHRQAKGAELGWEDEKYIYIAASRRSAPPPGARLIAPPRAASGQVMLKLCQPDGAAHMLKLTRRDGAPFKAARRLGWGDMLRR